MYVYVKYWVKSKSMLLISWVKQKTNQVWAKQLEFTTLFIMLINNSEFNNWMCANIVKTLVYWIFSSLMPFSDMLPDLYHGVSVDRNKPPPMWLQNDFIPKDVLFSLTQPTQTKEKLGPLVGGRRLTVRLYFFLLCFVLYFVVCLFSFTMNWHVFLFWYSFLKYY